MNCYWCSTQRRTELIRYAMERGFNKIALGHHLDDAVETLLMNMLYKGEIGGMLPLLRYRKYPLSIIRPLVLCEERQLVEYGKKGLHVDGLHLRLWERIETPGGPLQGGRAHRQFGKAETQTVRIDGEYQF
jgi:hypothetical protein